MPAISNLTRAKPTTATVDLGDGDTVTVEFDRNRITPAWVKAASEREAGEDPMSLPSALAEVILNWDVTNDDGTPFPPLMENLAVLSFPAQNGLLRAMLQAAVPGAAEGNASPHTSAAPSPASTPDVTSSQNGQATSTSPEPSASLSPT